MKKLLILVLVLAISIGGVLFFKWDEITLYRIGYEKEDREYILSLDKEEMKDYLSGEGVVDFSHWNEFDNDGHYFDYDLLERQTGGEEEEIIDRVDMYYKKEEKLLNLGYSKEFFREHFYEYNSEDISNVVSKKVSFEKAEPFLEVKNRVVGDIPAYIESKKSPLQAVISVTYPFINSSYSPKFIYTIEEPNRQDILVKWGFSLPDGYEPEDLVKCNLPKDPEVTNVYLRKVAAQALEKMAADAKKDGMILGIRSAYRSYKDQQEVYDYYMDLYGEGYVQEYVSIPGFSEHQTGLSLDITSQSVLDGVYETFEEAQEYWWMLENSYKYGFILRYPMNKTEITGTQNEPWHYRYVGKKLAKKIYDEDICLEEYYLKHGFSYTVD